MGQRKRPVRKAGGRSGPRWPSIRTTWTWTPSRPLSTRAGSGGATLLRPPYGFLDSADAGIMAAQYQERLMEDGLSVAGVDRAVEWAGGGLDAPTALIYMALFERSSNLRLDVEAAAWKAVPQPSAPAPEQQEEPPRDRQWPEPQEPNETAEQAEIRRLEARIRELQLPKVPPLSEGELTKIASGQHP